MRIVPNAGTDRVIDSLTPWLQTGARLDVITPELSLFAFAELWDKLQHVAGARVILPDGAADLRLTGSAEDRGARNQLKTHWFAGQLAEWVEKRAQALRRPNGRRTGRGDCTRCGWGSEARHPRCDPVHNGWPGRHARQSPEPDPSHRRPHRKHRAGAVVRCPMGRHQIGRCRPCPPARLVARDGDPPRPIHCLCPRSAPPFREPWRGSGRGTDRPFSHRDLRHCRLEEAVQVPARRGARRHRQAGDHNGCILADSVGLGKTFTALAVIKYYELRNKSVLVLAPKKLARELDATTTPTSRPTSSPATGSTTTCSPTPICRADGASRWGIELDRSTGATTTSS